MSPSSFWLIEITPTTVAVSLVSLPDGHPQVIGLGKAVSWDETDSDSILTAVDQSLSDTAVTAKLAESDEPSTASFILPPVWIDADGKIILSKRKDIESICRRLQLKPMGYIANDEAIIEESSASGDLPPSFILLYLEPNSFSLSLAYLGKIQTRINHSYSGQFDAGLVESALVELNSPSTLPPQIIVFGHTSPDIYQNLKNYPWIGKKNIETFLHFPEIKLYSSAELTQIYAQFINSQLNFPKLTSPADTVSADPLPPETTPVIFDTVAPDTLGFSPITDEVTPALSLPTPVSDEAISFKPPIEPPKPVKRPLTLPKIHLPPIRFKLSLLLLPLALSPLLILIPFYFSHATVTIFVSPYNFSRQINQISLNSNASTIDITNQIIPVIKNNFDLTVSDTIATTGQKTVGEKARGEVILFNKTDKVISLPKNSILSDSTGKKFELVTSVEIASSSSDLNLGVITLGQVKASVVAANIGPEYNLPNTTGLSLKDYSSNLVVIKISGDFTGGSQKQIQAVAQADRQNLESKINQSLTSLNQQNLSQKISTIPEVIKETVQIKKSNLDFNREVGEEADNLTATAKSTISVFSLKADVKQEIISGYLQSDQNFSRSIYDPNNFTLSFDIDKNLPTESRGKLTIAGKALPQIDTHNLQTKFKGRSQSFVSKYIQTEIPKMYSYNIRTNFNFLKAINPLPFIQNHLTVEVKEK